MSICFRCIGIYTDPGFTPTFLVTVLVTVGNMPSSPLIAQTNGLIAFIHRGSGAVFHSCSLSVLEVLGESSDPGVGGSIPSGRTINKQPAIARNPPGVNVETE